MSSESTIEYYRGIDAGINDARGGHSAGDIVIRSVNFAEVEQFIRTEQWGQAGAYLADAAAELEAAGAAFVVMFRLLVSETEEIALPNRFNHAPAGN